MKDEKKTLYCAIVGVWFSVRAIFSVFLSPFENSQQAPECRRSRYRSLDGSCNSRVNSNFGRTGDDHDHDHDYDHPDNDDDSTNLIIRFTYIKKHEYNGGEKDNKGGVPIIKMEI